MNFDFGCYGLTNFDFGSGGCGGAASIAAVAVVASDARPAHVVVRDTVAAEGVGDTGTDGSDTDAATAALPAIYRR